MRGMRGTRSSKRSGFARCEVAGAMGVVGVLAALVVPAGAQGGILDLIFGSGPRSKGAACQSNLKQLGLAVLQYTQDYDEIMPRASYRYAFRNDSFGWANAIQPYVKSNQVMQCPSEKHARSDQYLRSDEGFKKIGYTDYWYSSKLSGRPLSALASPAVTLSMGDGDGGSALSNARYNIAALPKSWATTPDSPARRHAKSGVQGANYAFADGHVKWYKPGSISSTRAATAAAEPTFALE